MTRVDGGRSRLSSIGDAAIADGRSQIEDVSRARTRGQRSDPSTKISFSTGVIG